MCYYYSKIATLLDKSVNYCQAIVKKKFRPHTREVRLRLTIWIYEKKKQSIQRSGDVEHDSAGVERVVRAVNKALHASSDVMMADSSLASLVRMPV
jgi:hypothetical protein